MRVLIGLNIFLAVGFGREANGVCQAWGLLEGCYLFNSYDVDGSYSRKRHPDEMVALLGPLPEKFIHRSPIWTDFFAEDGTLRSPHEDASTISLEKRETQLEGEDKKLFLKMVQSMLQWDPAERPTAEELRIRNLWMLKYK